MALAWMSSLLEPCLNCQPSPKVPKPLAATLRQHRAPGHLVELVTSPLAGLGGLAGYHSSVLVAGEEFHFSPGGICCSPKLCSHEGLGMERRVVGLSPYNGVDVLDHLMEHFRPGTYDLLRKNCNSFTDCALFFLCGERLDPCFSQVEQLGLVVDERSRAVQVMSGGEYQPNAKARDFQLGAVLAVLQAVRLGGKLRVEAGLECKCVASCKDSGGFVSETSTASGHSELSEEHPWLVD